MIAITTSSSMSVKPARLRASHPRRLGHPDRFVVFATRFVIGGFYFGLGANPLLDPGDTHPAPPPFAPSLSGGWRGRLAINHGITRLKTIEKTACTAILSPDLSGMMIR